MLTIKKRLIICQSFLNNFLNNFIIKYVNIVIVPINIPIFNNVNSIVVNSIVIIVFSPFLFRL